MANFCRNRFCPTSLSARRAWIEIVNAADQAARQRVALRKESVDRNSAGKLWAYYNVVALRKESVDRNREQFKYVVQCRKVALRKESVDRNVDR